MAFWNRKKTEATVTPNKDMLYGPDLKKPACAHKYRDFHWYIEGEYRAHPPGMFSIRIIEPYVCVWCGDRKNQVLQEIVREGNMASKSEMVEVTKSLMDTYGDKIRPRAFVEDEINDMQLVDRDYLRALALIHPEKLNGMDEKAKVALQKS